MMRLIFSWGPLFLMLLAYHITWPKRISVPRRLLFDLLLVVLISLPAVVLWAFPKYFAEDPTDYLEMRVWLPYSIPLWMTVTAIPLVLIAVAVRRTILKKEIR